MTARSRYLVLAKKTGQLGNRLVVFAHCLAAARERGYTLYNPSLCEYADFFVGTRGQLAACAALPDPQRLIPRWRRHLAYALTRCLYRVVKPLQYLSFGRWRTARARNRGGWLDLKTVVDRADAGGCRLLVCQGYHFRHNAWVERHAGFIREFLAPLPVYREAAAATLTALRRDCAVVVGVHIRHGDYKEYCEGRYFYSAAVYAQLMAKVQALFPGQSVGFVLCSNAPQDPAEFAALRTAPGPGHLVEDLAALAGCDWIMGPPSSFSNWAAFYGEKPLWRIEDAEHAPTLADFRRFPAPDPDCLGL